MVRKTDHEGVWLQAWLDPSARLWHRESSVTPAILRASSVSCWRLPVTQGLQADTQQPRTELQSQFHLKSWNWILLDLRLITEPVTVPRRMEEANWPILSHVLTTPYPQQTVWKRVSPAHTAWNESGGGELLQGKSGCCGWNERG